MQRYALRAIPPGASKPPSLMSSGALKGLGLVVPLSHEWSKSSGATKPFAIPPIDGAADSIRLVQ